MIALFTTARKALVAAVATALSPPTALLLSDQPISWRVMLASVLTGIVAGLSTYELRNTEPYEPTGRHFATTSTTDVQSAPS